MKMNTSVNFAGKCADAFRFYEQHLGGRITGVTRHGTAPNPALPDGWTDRVLHARLELGGTVVMGADIPGAEPMRSAYLTLRLESVEEAERVYSLLGEGGQIFMKMEETFFAPRFAMLRDRFGTSWMLMYERQADQAWIPWHRRGRPRQGAERRFPGLHCPSGRWVGRIAPGPRTKAPRPRLAKR